MINWKTGGPLQGNHTDRGRGISNFVRSIGQLLINIEGQISQVRDNILEKACCKFCTCTQAYVGVMG